MDKISNLTLRVVFPPVYIMMMVPLIHFFIILHKNFPFKSVKKLFSSRAGEDTTNSKPSLYSLNSIITNPKMKVRLLCELIVFPSDK